MSHTKYLRETMQNEYNGLKNDDYSYKAIYKQKLMDFRKEDKAITRLERPSNLSRAKSLGYKAKRGIFVVRVMIRKGSGGQLRPTRGREPRNLGVNKLTRGHSIRSIAEQRASRKHPNAEVLNSYWAAEDGKHEFYEVILVDANAPEIKADKNLRWICERKQKGRAFRGLTSSLRKGRGLMKKGKGAERVRPSRRAHKRKSK